MRVLRTTIVSALLLTAPLAAAQDGNTMGLVSPDAEELPPVLPAEQPFLESTTVSEKVDSHDGFRVFADGRYEIYGDKVFHRLPDGSVKWTPIELGWHPLKTLDQSQVMQIAFAARHSGILDIPEKAADEKPASEPIEGAMAPSMWTWTVRMDGEEKVLVVIDYLKTRAPEAEHLYRQVQSIAFESP